MTNPLTSLSARRASGDIRGITSICSAHPLVIEAALRRAVADDAPVLIEATCNQVNQDGGYTGMTPAAFRSFVETIAARVGLPPDRLILGGDHLGPNPWKRLPPDGALAAARTLVAACARAGFAKLHLDASMGCAGEPEALPDDLVAARAADLAAVAEGAASAAGASPPLYVIGTEVPVPGGATHAFDQLRVTTPSAARDTLEIHRRAFAARNLEAAFARIIALVVQPGVEFGNDSVAVYQPAAAHALSASLADMTGVVFEAHSTDYQPPDALAALVRDGFAILKVGPALTFALREALYALDHIASALDGDPPALAGTMEQIMLANPGHWRSWIGSAPADARWERHFGYSDRIRYYWPESSAKAAIKRLLARFDNRRIPAPLISQYLAALHASVIAGRVQPEPHALLRAAIDQVLGLYRSATSTCVGPD